MTQEEIQKQIEAVKGLIEGYNQLNNQNVYDVESHSFEKQLEVLCSNLRTLTETLKPYLDGEKLEV